MARCLSTAFYIFALLDRYISDTFLCASRAEYADSCLLFVYKYKRNTQTQYATICVVVLTPSPIYHHPFSLAQPTIDHAHGSGNVYTCLTFMGCCSLVNNFIIMLLLRPWQMISRLLQIATITIGLIIHHSCHCCCCCGSFCYATSIIAHIPISIWIHSPVCVWCLYVAKLFDILQ